MKIKAECMEELEKFGFKVSKNTYHNGIPCMENGFLMVNQDDRIIQIISGVDEVNGDEELIIFYKLVKADMVEE